MCSIKSMLKVGLAIIAVFAVAYTLLPGSRTWMASLAPALTFLICPISMLVGLKMISGKGCSNKDADSLKAIPLRLVKNDSKNV